MSDLDPSLPDLECGPVTPAMVQAFAVIQNDFNPIHVSDEAARAAGFPRAIVHGAFVFGQLERFARSLKLGRLVALRCQFVRPLLVGDMLVIAGRQVRAEGPSIILRVLARNGSAEVLAIAEATLDRAGPSP